MNTTATATTIGDVGQYLRATRKKARALKEQEEKRALTENEENELIRLASGIKIAEDLEERRASGDDPTVPMSVNGTGNRVNQDSFIGEAMMRAWAQDPALKRFYEANGGKKYLEKRAGSLYISDDPGFLMNPTGIDTTSPFFLLMRDQEFISKTGINVRRLKNFHRWAQETASAVPVWQSGEGVEVPLDTALAIGSKDVSLKTIVINVPISEQLLRDEPETPRHVQRLVMRALMQEIQRVLLVGSGASGEPTGMESTASVLTTDFAGTFTYAKMRAQLKQLHAQGCVPEDLSFVAGTTVMDQWLALTDTTGQPLNMPPILRDMPKFFSKVVPETYDTNTHTKSFMFSGKDITIAIDPPTFDVIHLNGGQTLTRNVRAWFGYDHIVHRPNAVSIGENIDLA